MVALLKKELHGVAMKVTCRQIMEGMRFRAHRISHYVAVVVLSLAFYTKDPSVVVDAVKIFLFLDLPPLEVL